VPNAAIRTDMLAAGWIARVGDYTNLFANTSGQHKASA
jgi:hypothetical protein